MGPKAVALVLLVGLCAAQEASEDGLSSGEVVEATEDVLHSGSATWAKSLSFKQVAIGQHPVCTYKIYCNINIISNTICNISII